MLTNGQLFEKKYKICSLSYKLTLLIEDMFPQVKNKIIERDCR